MNKRLVWGRTIFVVLADYSCGEVVEKSMVVVVVVSNFVVGTNFVAIIVEVV